MAINETWFAESSYVKTIGYYVYRRDRASHAGGICICMCTCKYDVILTNTAMEQVPAEPVLVATMIRYIEIGSSVSNNLKTQR